MFPVYGEHFGLKAYPFSVGCDPEFLYDSPSYKKALVELSDGVRARDGMMVLTGEVGTGKTTLVRSLLRQIEDGRTRTAFISTLVFDFRELLHCVCRGFGLEDGALAADELSLFNDFVFAAYQNGDNVALAIDEAQHLSRDMLVGVKQLSDVEFDGEKLLQIVLVGEPDLEARLDEPGMQLNQSVASRWRLSPLSRTECREYIAKHLEIAGGAAAIFPEPTAEAVYAFSGGIPRLINTLCDRGLLAAYKRDETRVEREIIESIACSLHIDAAPQRQSAAASAPKRIALSRHGAVARSRNGNGLRGKANGAGSHGQAPVFQTAATASTVPPQSFDRLVAALTDAMGPMAALVVSERLVAMGELQASFPTQRFGELVEATGGEILSAPLKQRYRSIMAQELRALGAKSV